MTYYVMSGSGNEFIVLDYRKGGIDLRRLLNLVKWEGVDGLLLLEESYLADFKMRIMNPDGSEAEMCGNGARCIAKFAKMQGILKDTIDLETLAGLVHAEVLDEGVKLRMKDPHDLRLNKELRLDGRTILAHSINTGVPHTIILEDRLLGIDVDSLGRMIRFHPDFKPEGTNVDFISIINPSTIKIRTYERGVEGETQACGTGAAASACIAYLLGKVRPPVKVLPISQEALIVYFEYYKDKITNLSLEGGVKIIKQGEI